MASEPFPILNTSADQLHTAGDAPRRRRKSSVFAEHNGDARPRDPSQVRPPSLVPVSRSPLTLPLPPPLKYAYRSRRMLTKAPLPLHQPDHQKRLSKRRRAKLGRAMSRHTSLLPFLVVVAFLTIYALNPTPSNPVHRFIFLSYPEPPTEPGAPFLYGKGLWDLALVSFYTVVLSFTREFFMNEVFRPLARRAGLPRSKQARFMEQMYTALYFGLSGPAGMYVMSRTPVWYFNTRGMFEGYPHHSQEGVVKFYYLFQAAYWLQQAVVLVLGMEKPRKDFKELVGHHIVTLALIACSYRFHFTYIGLAVYTTHDISDFFLAVCFFPSLFLLSPLRLSLNIVYYVHWKKRGSQLTCRMYTDLQDAQVSRLPHPGPLLRPLHGLLDLHAPLPEPAHHLLPLHRVQDRRPLPPRLGGRLLQVRDRLLHHPHLALRASGPQPLLARIYRPHRVALRAI